MSTAHSSNENFLFCQGKTTNHKAMASTHKRDSSENLGGESPASNKVENGNDCESFAPGPQPDAEQSAPIANECTVHEDDEIAMVSHFG